MIESATLPAKKTIWQQFVSICRPYWQSEIRGQAFKLLGVLLLLLVLVNGLNVVINYVSGRFMTALSGKDQPTFYHMLALYFSVFVVGTPIVVFYSWMTDKLGLHWRTWLTKHMIDKYLGSRAYYHIDNQRLVDNPDERIAQDVRDFTRTAVTLLLNVLSSIVTLFSFIFILWTISHKLVGIVCVYSLVGTAATLYMGRRLVRLKFDQLRKEADLRYNLIHVRNNVESIAFYRGEKQEGKQIKERLFEAVNNFNLVIGWQRNVGFLTTGYNYLVVLIPALVIAPLYFQGKVPFGAETQADMAFAQILAALSLIITSIDDVTAFVAQIKRLGSFDEAMEKARNKGDSKTETSSGDEAENKSGDKAGDKTEDKTEDRIETVVCERFSFRHVTLYTPNSASLNGSLVSDLSLTVKQGANLLITGSSGAGKSSLLRAICGLWDRGVGTIERPPLDQIMFLPQRPYMILGSLKEQLLYPRAQAHINQPFDAKDVANVDSSVDLDEESLRLILKEVNLPDLVDRVGGFDAIINWSDVLSLGEQQRLAFARLLVKCPAHAILDEATSALDLRNEQLLYELLRRKGISYISVGHRPSLTTYHDQILELTADRGWQLNLIETRAAA